MTDANTGPGWYEVINPRTATTNIAYVREDGSLYLPEGDDLTAEEFAFAAARGNAHRLIRADEIQQLTPCTCRQAVHAAEHTGRPVATCTWCMDTPDIRPGSTPPTTIENVELP